MADKSKRVAEKKNVKTQLRITDTTLRDAHQSLWATRMRTSDILDIIDVIDSAGYYSLEMWGGATFDVCLRFLRENPWERLRQIKSRAKKTPLQMLLRGQNILGYKNYADDLLDRFVALACHNGIDIFRIFDALNDSRNLEYAIKAVKKYGGHAQGTLSYTISPYHTTETFVKSAKEQVDMGIDTLCIKDMAGILSPVMAEELVSALVSEVNVPIQLHCHSSSGMALPAYFEGVKAGAGAIDCAISSIGGFSSQPPVETAYAIFEEAGYDTGIDREALRKISSFFDSLAPKRQPTHKATKAIDPEILIHQIPGGMISNLRSQLAQQKALDRIDDVLNEVPNVRADLGYPPLVTPTSQIVGTQAVLNILAGSRYEMVPNEIRNYVKGLYGRPPAKMDPEFIKSILGDEKPIDHRPADDIEPMLPNAAEDIDPTLIEHEEDIISYCLFPEQALEYFKWRAQPEHNRSEIPADIELREQQTAIDKGQQPSPTKKPEDSVFMAPNDLKGINELIKTANALNIAELVIRKGDRSIALKSGTASQSFVTETIATEPESQVVSDPEPAATTEAQPTTVAAAGNASINSPLMGQFYSAVAPGKPKFVNPGDTVKAGDTVCIVEAMKLINEIKAEKDCRVVNILCDDGQSVEKGQALISVEEL